MSQGKYETIENPAADNCTMVCDDPEFDSYVSAAIQEVGLPFYSIIFNVNAMDCQMWVKRVLIIAKRNYLADRKCPKCFK